jgi:flavodoxin
MNWLMIVGLVVLGIVVVIAAMGLIFCGDMFSYTATGSQVLDPAGASAGKALVVYDPGVSGAAKNAAASIASGLQSKGYTVTLAGVKSPAADNVSGYNVIMVGGPMYFGTVSNSVDAYLKALKPQNTAAIGVFATTGSQQSNSNDIASFGKQVTADLGNGRLSKPAVTQTIRSGNSSDTDCADLVSAILS